MIKIVDKRSTEKVAELPSLPFVTEWDGDYFLYFENNEGMISCLDLANGETQLGEYENIEEAVKTFDPCEKIVEIEVHVVK